MSNSDNPNVYGLLGRNISYSLSRVMHNAAFQQLEIPGTYQNFDKQENELEDFIGNELLSGKISGINVTVPYKIKIKEILENKYSVRLDVDGLTRSLGAVNTIIVDDDKLLLRNTDSMGFFDALTGDRVYEDLYSDAGFRDMKAKEIVVLGAGGAGRTVCLTLMHMANTEIKEIYVFDVDNAILHDFEMYSAIDRENSLSFDKIRFLKTYSDLEAVVKHCDLIVNATPLGTKEDDPAPVNPELFKSGAVVFDLVYARETELLKKSRQRELTAISGLGMLVYQGARSFYLWTEDFWKNKNIDREEARDRISKIMFKAVREELDRRK